MPDFFAELSKETKNLKSMYTFLGGQKFPMRFL